jgi:hypothetical protein
MDAFLVLSGAIVAAICTGIVGFDYWSMRRPTDMERAEREALDHLMRGEFAQ